MRNCFIILNYKFRRWFSVVLSKLADKDIQRFRSVGVKAGSIQKVAVT